MASRSPEQRPLGRSDLTVTSLGLGTAALCVPYGAPGKERPAPSRPDAEATVAAALEAGVRFIDTAPAYGDAEDIVGTVAGASSCVIATKLAIPSEGWAALDEAAARDAVRRSVEASLRMLRRERIDLLQIHNADADVLGHGALVPSMQALRDEGLVTALGATVYGEEAALAAISRPEIDVIQVAHNVLDRRTETTVIPRASSSSVAVTTRSALLRGVLSPAGRDLKGLFTPLTDAADAFRRAVGASWEDLPGAALAWSVSRPGVVATVMGPRDTEELHGLLDGAAAFSPRIKGIADDWHRDLPSDLLDPSRWTALDLET